MNESALPALDAAHPPHVVRFERDAGTPAVALDPDSAYEDLRAALRLALGDGGPHADLRGHALQLDFGARDLALFDLRRLTHLLRDEFDITTAGVRCTPAALHRYAEQSLKLRVHLAEVAEADAPCAPDDALAPCEAPGPEAPVEAPVEAAAEASAEDAPAEPTPAEAPAEPTPPAAAAAAAAADADTPVDARVYAIHRTLRSGARVRHSGDVVVYGDVNAGAQVEADGNIVVLGALRGLAHAGARGDESAVILSFDLRPTQLRIGTRIAFPPERPAAPTGGLRALLQREPAAPRGYSPEIARVDGDAIILEDYRGRLPAGGR